MYIKSSGTVLNQLETDIISDARTLLATIEQMVSDQKTLQGGWQSVLSAGAHNDVATKLNTAAQSLQALMTTMGGQVGAYTETVAANEQAAAAMWSA